MNTAILDDYQPALGGRHPLLALDHAICVPHRGDVEREGLEHMFSTIFVEVLAYAAGAPINVVNPEVLQPTRG